MPDVSWAMVPVWIGTLTAAVSAIVAALSYRRSVLNAERAQASRVSVWLSDEVKRRLLHREGGTKLELRTTIFVANRSEAPVYDVVATVYRQHPYIDVLSIREIPGGAVAEADVVMEFGEATVSEKESWRGDDRVFKPEIRQPTVEFTDALGRRWRRDGDKLFASAGLEGKRHTYTFSREYADRSTGERS